MKCKLDKAGYCRNCGALREKPGAACVKSFAYGKWVARKSPLKEDRVNGEAYTIEMREQKAVLATVKICCGWEGANARILAAAPELLNALELLLTEHLNTNGPKLAGSDRATDKAIAAICKAHGWGKA